ncbi:hypothetical protein L0665_00090 [Methanogenium marinum]|uniref:Uncharacterized protein n=1 Tax=Methanogenium marinum TaxID=348610 RepID=A0A9Q4KRV6_9EURY|nr:hypothetical protein [Methanogenium marinum]MDE4907028.1 hypothetical protein [Methanogenium marinum]
MVGENCLFKIVLLILLIAASFICGCTAPGGSDDKDEWIILPEYDDPDGSISALKSSDFAEGDYNGLVVYAVPESSGVVQGSNVTVTVIFANDGNSPVNIEDFPPEFLIQNPADLSQPFGIVKRYLRGDDDITILPGENIMYDIKWDSSLNDTGVEISPGLYTLEITDVMTWDGKTEMVYRGESGKKIAEIGIRPDGEILRKTIPVNISQESEGITITFDRIDATENSTELFFSVYVPEPVYETEMDDGTIWSFTLSSDDKPNGYYRIDGGDQKSLWNMNLIGSSDNTYTYRSRIEPLSSEIKEMSVEINHFGSLTGQWKFDVSLSE